MASMAETPIAEAAKSEATAQPSITELYGPEGTLASDFPVQDPPKDVTLPRGTNVFWRILEGLSAVAVLASLGSWLLRRRSTRWYLRRSVRLGPDISNSVARFAYWKSALSWIHPAAHRSILNSSFVGRELF